MKLRTYPETDSLTIELKDAPGAETREVAPGLNVDLDAGRRGRFRHRPRFEPPRSHDAGNGRPSNSDDEGRLMDMNLIDIDATT